MITDTQKEETLLKYYERGILKKEVRSYEVSLWTLQDQFITVLKWSDVEQKGRIQNPKMKLDIDGTENFTFSIPMYLAYWDEHANFSAKLIKKENPIWYNTRNGNLIEGMRKIKVIFNKTTRYELVFEFIIIKISEKHDENDIATCDIECEGLAFHELGKLGYKISLSQENFELDYKEWAKKGYWEKPNKTKIYTKPILNVLYWCENGIGLVPWPGVEAASSNIWYYYIDMDWSSFAFSESIGRDTNIVYEEPFTSSWDENLTPLKVLQYQEKARPVEISQSNLYNITQTIAEQFGIHCRYDYYHDENYCITYKVIVFYNSYNREKEGILGFTYPYTAKNITRNTDATDLTTKLFISSIDSDNELESVITIMNSDANKIKEDYILNFDYIHEIGGITDELYEAVPEFEKAIREKNELLIPLQLEYEAFANKKIELEAKKTIYTNSISLDKELKQYNSDLYNALDLLDKEDDGLIHITSKAPDTAMILTSEDGKKYINLLHTKKGIQASTVLIWNNWRGGSGICVNEISNFGCVYDEYGNLISITFDNPNLLVDRSVIDWENIFNTYYVPLNYSGNVNLMNRMIVPAASFINAGYEFEGTYGTLYSSAISESDSSNTEYVIIYTPIEADGTVLTYPLVEQYFNDIFAKSETYGDWKKLDKANKSLILNIVSLADYDQEGSWEIDLHNRLEEWDLIRAANDWFGSEVNPSNVEITPKTSNYTYCTLLNITSNTSTNNSNTVYLTYKYQPKLYYDNIVKTWDIKLANDTKNLAEVETELESVKNHMDTDQESIDLLIEEKNGLITEFERTMGPALREGYWDPEDYRDYGDLRTATLSLPSTYTPNVFTTENKAVDVILDWDDLMFDDELKIYYEITVNNSENRVYYPCVNLSSFFSNENIRKNINKYSFIFNTNYYKNDADLNNIKYIRSFSIGSEALLRFVKNSLGMVFPVLVLIGAKNMTDGSNGSFNELEFMKNASKGNPRLGIISTEIESTNVSTKITNVTRLNNNSYWTFGSDSIENCVQVYPRVKFNTTSVKADTTNLNIIYNNILLTAYTDYQILTRITHYGTNEHPIDQTEYYINLKPEALWSCGTYTGNATISYIISTLATSIYVDALEIAEKNSKPKVEYSLDANIVSDKIMHHLYLYLARIIMINDVDLKLKDAYGYISGVDLDLDSPENDTIEVRNYATKFEDLFSTIVASTESILRAGTGISSALGGNIGLSNTGLTATLKDNEQDLENYLDIYFTTSHTVLDVLKSLFTEAGEILSDSNKILGLVHALSIKNASILGLFAERVKSELSPKVVRSKTRPADFKVGDIWIEVDDNGEEIGRYVATSDSLHSVNGYGFTRTFDGSLAQITGANLDIDAENGSISILGENEIFIGSGNNVKIHANEMVEIVGNRSVNIGGTAINLATATIDGKNVESGINIVSAVYDNLGVANISKVCINPREIYMAGSKITMLTGVANESTNAIVIDGTTGLDAPEYGIWMGSSKGILLSSNSAGNTTVANVEILPTHILFGMGNLSSNSSTAVEITDTLVLLAAGTVVNAGSTTEITTTSTTSGVQVKSNYIGLAAGVASSSNYRSLVAIRPSGIVIGNAKGSSITEDSFENNNGSEGTYVSISGSGITIGSSATFTADTANFKVNPSPSSNGTDYFYVGDSGSSPASYIRYVKDTTNYLQIKGRLTADTLSIGSGGSVMKYDSTNGLDIGNGSLTYNNSTLSLTGDVQIGGQTLALTINANLANIGSWTVSSEHLGNAETRAASTIGMANVTSGTVFWAGGEYTSTPKFRVTNDGSVYLNALMLLDKVTDGKWEITNTAPDNNDNHFDKYTEDEVLYGYTPIEFSKLNFNEAISLSLTWSGTTLTAKANLWGKFSKKIEGTAGIIITGVTCTDGGAEQGTGVSGIASATTLIGNAGSSAIINNISVTVNAHSVYLQGWKDAANFPVLLDTENKLLTGLPSTSAVAYSRTMDVSAMWNAGAKKCWDNTTVVVNSSVDGNTVNYWATVTNGLTEATKSASGSRTVTSGTGCFAAGSLVTLADGSRIPIEKLGLGMKLLAYDEENNKFVPTEIEILQVIKNRVLRVVELHLSSNNVLIVTAEHPFLTEDGWSAIDTENAIKVYGVGSRELQIGDKLISTIGDVYIEDIIERHDLYNTTVYHLDVEPYDTYVVENVVVHNDDSVAPK